MSSAVLDTATAARWFHAMSDETRLEIVDRLLQGERCVCELADDVDAAQSRLSFHLKTLKDAGLVDDRRDGRWMYYTLNREAFADMESYIGTLKHAMRHARKSAKCCD